MAAATRPLVYLDVNIGSEPFGRLVVELFDDKAPKTCDNFRALCIGSHPPLTYKLSRFHRIISDFAVQGGDITKDDGAGVESIFGGDFSGENLDWREFDIPYLLCMANRGKCTNSSQFFITLAPSPHLYEKHTVFGQLVSGYDILSRIADIQVDSDYKPLTDVIIADCGELERPKRITRASSNMANLPSKRASGDSHSTDRGRGKRRRSPTSDLTSSRSPSHSDKHRKHAHRSSRSPQMQAVPTKERHRRRSDHSVDENLRGRPRRRSNERMRMSSPIAEDDDLSMAEDRASGSRHGRRRSRSPSPYREDEDSQSQGFRRRRSLPNHYERRREYAKRQDVDDRDFGHDSVRMDDEQTHDMGSNNSSRWAKSPRDEARLKNEGAGGSGDVDVAAGSSGGETKFRGRANMRYRERNRF